MLPAALVLLCLFLGVVATGAVIALDVESLSTLKGLCRGRTALNEFQRTYVVVYLLATMGDWLQGPFVYALYDAYGFSRQDNGTLFVMGFGSSAVFGTFVGALADRRGRRKFAMMYCALYVVSCLTKHASSYAFLMLGRLTGGVATSLLFSVFDAWLVSEHRSRGFHDDQLGGTFALAVFGNGVVAIVAGELGQAAADARSLTKLADVGVPFYYGGNTTPFDVAICCLLVCMALMLCTWSENYGEGALALPNPNGLHSEKGMARAMRAMWEHPLILYCGIVCSLFESSMFVFVFNWTPCLTEPGQHIPHGHIFAAFMVCSMLGSRVFAFMSQTMTAERLGIFTLVVASASHAVVIFVENVVLRFLAFLVFELCVGLYFPMMGTLKGQIVPEDVRSTVYNLYRVPLNALVLVVLVFNLSSGTSFMLTTSLLGTAALAQSRLAALRARRAARRPADRATARELQDLRPHAVAVGRLEDDAGEGEEDDAVL